MRDKKEEKENAINKLMLFFYFKYYKSQKLQHRTLQYVNIVIIRDGSMSSSRLPSRKSNSYLSLFYLFITGTKVAPISC